MNTSLESVNIKRILSLFLYLKWKNHIILTESKSKKGFTWDIKFTQNIENGASLKFPQIQHCEWD